MSPKPATLTRRHPSLPSLGLGRYKTESPRCAATAMTAQQGRLGSMNPRSLHQLRLPSHGSYFLEGLLHYQRVVHERLRVAAASFRWISPVYAGYATIVIEELRYAFAVSDRDSITPQDTSCLAAAHRCEFGGLNGTFRAYTSLKKPCLSQKEF
jgi:hypothetical protein